MKKLTLLYLLCVSLTIQAQDFTASQNTFLSLNVLPEGAILDKLDSYEPKTSREKKHFEESKDYLQALLTEMSIALLYEELETKKSIKLEDKDALRDFATYGNDGLPIVIIPKAAIKKLKKKGYESDYYFRFNITIGLNLLMKGLPGQLKPEVTCSAKVFDMNGKVVKKVEEKIKTKTAIKMKDFPNRKFDKLDKDYMDLLVEKLKPQITDAVVAAVQQF